MCLPPSSSTQRGRTLQLGPCAYRDPPRCISPAQLGIALQLGPDFLLAPAGLVADKGGLRPGRLLEEAIGALVSPEAQWLRDRREELAASAPLAIRALVFVLFAAAALPVGRLLQLVSSPKLSTRATSPWHSLVCHAPGRHHVGVELFVPGPCLWRLHDL